MGELLIGLFIFSILGVLFGGVGNAPFFITWHASRDCTCILAIIERCNEWLYRP